MGGGDSLRVDPERLSNLGGQMVDAAIGLPAAPPPFVEAGTDPLSQAIRDMLPDVEGPIQEALPKLKTEATKTANNIVTAAGHYQRTDEQLAGDYDEHRFDGMVGSGAGSAGTGGSSGGGDSMGQLMGMPMQMASQAAQVPMQAVGALASVPQGVMQGVQQFGQMAGGMGKSEDKADLLDLPTDRQDDEAKKDHQQGAAPGATAREAVPGVGQPPIPVVPQPGSARHEAPDPAINL